MDMMEVADPDAVHAVRTFIRKQLAHELKAELLSTVWHFSIYLEFCRAIYHVLCLLFPFYKEPT